MADDALFHDDSDPEALEHSVLEIFDDLRSVEPRLATQQSRELRLRLIELGPPVVPVLLRHVGRFDPETDDWGDIREFEIAMEALGQIDDQRGRDFLVECGAALMAGQRTEDENVMLFGVDAIDAMGKSDDPALHEQLVRWVLAIDTTVPEDSSYIWHLVDAARPHLDERARPVIEVLAKYDADPQDIQPSARRALAALDELDRRNTDR